jgi:hypothetical protein
MPSPLADRNLLFGILALQMDFISRDALISAMSAWVLDKSRALGHILQEQGALRADRRALLDSLVENHLEMHAGDARQSLAAVASVHPVRQELEQIADADVQASLVHVGDTPTNDPLATSAHVGPANLPPHARFQILRPHARGGLGEVFVALDGELEREVALKEIQQRHADHDESRARFLMEAKVTGGLEHPGIVPVYGLGVYPDGRPYYAMRFIKGDSLKDAIAEFHKPQAQGLQPLGFHSLAFRQLLGRFVDVCNAVAYAHSRGVLHRDLKPVLLKHREQAIARMRKEMAARPDYWKDLPLDPKWQAPDPELVREVEQAGGIVAERFALCQALPLERVAAVTEGLRGAGYRPVRVRPWDPSPPAPLPEAERGEPNTSPKRKRGDSSPPLRFGEGVGGRGLFVALVWTRDGIDWTLRTGLTAAQAKDAPASMVPADVAGYHTKDGVRHAMLWRKPGKGEQAVVYAGVPEAEHKSETDGFQNDGYIPATVQAFVRADGTVRISGVWWKGLDKPANWFLSWTDTEPVHDDFVFAGEHLLPDVHLGQAVPANQAAWAAGLVAAPLRWPRYSYRTIARFALWRQRRGTMPASGATTRRARPSACTD